MNDVTRILSAIERATRRRPAPAAGLRRAAQLAARGSRLKKPGQTLQATALVHEAYLRLVGEQDPGWDGRGHFFAAAAEAMRRILVENARRKQRLKRGGNRGRRDLDETALSVAAPVGGPEDDLLALDAALTKLAGRDPLRARLVQLRYFSGLSVAQAAEVLGISPSTADR
ncbi:MAG: ECF-type sigma factor, partial [Singulisphaera sp.]